MQRAVRIDYRTTGNGSFFGSVSSCEMRVSRDGKGKTCEESSMGQPRSQKVPEGLKEGGNDRIKT
jgi:hypothetical protein